MPVRFLKIFLTFLLLPFMAAKVVHGQMQPRERTALGTIFDEVQVIEAAVPIVQRAQQLNIEDRYQFLAAWVLPNEDHTSLRMTVGFTPTGIPDHLSPTANHADKIRQAAGANIACPAEELVRTATALGRLPEIRKRIEACSSESPDAAAGRLAALALVDCAAGAFNTAKDELGQLYKVVAVHQQIKSAWYGPLIVAVKAGYDHEVTAAAARDLAFHVLQMQIGNISSGQWSSFDRQMMRMAEQCIVQLSNNPALLGSEARLPAAAQKVGDEGADDAEEDVELPLGLRDIRSEKDGLKQWQSSALLTASSNAAGSPNDVWHWDGHAIYKASGHRKEYLYFQSPLRGDFEIEFDASASAWRNVQVMIGGHWTGARTRTDYLFGMLDNPAAEYGPLSPQISKYRTTMHYRAVVRGVEVSFYGNGRLFRTVDIGENSDPWVAFGRLAKNSIRIWNVRITGNPVVPKEICLSDSKDLTGWITYYRESIGGTADQARRWRQDGDPDTGGIISSSRKSDLELGSHQESLAYYHRPMLEDGTIDYEFRYEKDLWHTHPALGRTVFLLEPEGVRVHELTDGVYETRDIDPGNAFVKTENRRGPETLPLLSDEWNFVQLKVTGDTVNVYLNDQHVYEHQIEAHNQRHFGLFHYSDQSRAYAHNIVWRGNWAKELPSLSQQELIERDTKFLDEGLAKLTAKFTHTFNGERLPDDAFTTPYTRAEDVMCSPDGLTVQRQGTKSYEKSIIEAGLGASGDFDIRMSFDNFTTQPDPAGGNGNVYLQLQFDNATKTEFHVRRRHFRYPDREEESHKAYADYVERHETETRRDAIGEFPTEATAGTLRLARRGEIVYALYAEGDSEDFRIVSKRNLGTDDVAVGGIRLRLLTYMNTFTSVRFKMLDVRAERLTGPATVGPPSQDPVAELNAKRANLPVQTSHDFSKQPAFGPDFYTVGKVLPWRPDGDGQELMHEGRAKWSASWLTLRSGFAGDFDITTTFKLQKIEHPEAGRESGMYLKIHLTDPVHHQPEMMYRIKGADAHEFEARIGRRGSTGGNVWERVRGLRCDGGMSMRIARYGTTAYYLTRQAPDKPEILVATLDVTDTPIRENGIYLMVHAMGEGRTTYGRFKTLEVRAQQKISAPAPTTVIRRSVSPAPVPPAKPAEKPKSFLESLFDVF